MDKSLYFDGRQIKNYIIGFASLFSEIPYKTRKGTLDVVPIHYGSPSDIISYLEMNVDNEETRNRNRLKDISVPLFSFRMTGIERNVERRRAPHDSITVDLRKLGYGTGYVAMRPTPLRFTMELVLWASSDYQAFEISEQILPYFNSPQQVTIEPLPKCPVSTTEINMESVEIETDPDSQKYSALVTMTFSLTGWILTQPKIWSTNMEFELSMLDKEYKNLDNYNDKSYSFDNEIIDNNTNNPNKEIQTKDLSTLESFIKNSNLYQLYGTDLDYFKILVDENRIDPETLEIIDDTLFETEYKGEQITIYPKTISFIADVMTDIKYLFTNEKLKNSLANHSIKDDLSVMSKLLNDSSNSIQVYTTLVDNNLVTNGFNRTDVELPNSEKLRLFGNMRLDIDNILERLSAYESSFDEIKILKDQIVPNLQDDILFSINPINPSQQTIKKIQEKINYVTTYKYDDIDLDSISSVIDNNLIISLTKINANEISIYIDDVEINSTSDDKLLKYEYKKNTTKSLILILDGVLSIYSLSVFDSTYIVYDKFNTQLSDNLNILDLEKFKIYDENEFDIMTKKYYKLFNILPVINSKFIESTKFIEAALIYKTLNIETKDDIENNEMVKIFLKQFSTNLEDFIISANSMINFIDSLNRNLDKLSKFSNIPNVKPEDIVQNQLKLFDGLAIKLIYDKNGKPIYDVNEDGFINKEDLTIIGAEVDNPESFDYELKYGMWYKRFDITKVTEDRLVKISENLKTIYFLIEKTDFSEFKDFINLKEHNLISDTYDIDKSEYGIKKLESLGYDAGELDNKLLFMRLFVESIKNITIKEKDLLVYNIPNMSDENKKWLYSTENLNIDDMAIGEFVEKYLGTIIDQAEKLKDEQKIRDILEKPLGYYYDSAFKFKLFWNDILNSEFFIDSLAKETVWLDRTFPELSEKIKNINK